jgi:hypothetical protein
MKLKLYGVKYVSESVRETNTVPLTFEPWLESYILKSGNLVSEGEL